MAVQSIIYIRAWDYYNSPSFNDTNEEKHILTK